MGILAEVAPPVKQGMIEKGSNSAALHDGLVVDACDVLLDKPRFGAFHGTDLELILRSRGIDTVIVSGIATNVCCETTAREAMVRDFRVLFLSDATAATRMGDLTAEELQEATLATLGTVFGQVLTVEEVIQKICHAQVPSAPSV
jgi:ureidoacrylate peracid hydrolase